PGSKRLHASEPNLKCRSVNCRKVSGRSACEPQRPNHPESTTKRGNVPVQFCPFPNRELRQLLAHAERRSNLRLRAWTVWSGGDGTEIFPRSRQHLLVYRRYVSGDV